MKQCSITVIDQIKITRAYKHLPHVKFGNKTNHICSRCFYVNATANHFCTNCGYPVQPGNTQLLYQFRTKQRKEILKKSLYFIQVARVLLYVIAIFFTVGIAFLFGNLSNRFFLAILAVTSSALFFVLARWSLSKPFTALLTAFVIILTFSTIAVFGEFTHTFTSVDGIYTIGACLAVLYFLVRGVQAAYKADLINEEMHIN
ncbi:MAG: hypothetical protein ABI861_08535 [Panacibacter sp.]